MAADARVPCPVAEITDSAFFQDLRLRANDLRQIIRGEDEANDPSTASVDAPG